jgi:methenyltetrahydromethanopterin cyclohydrolase
MEKISVNRLAFQILEHLMESPEIYGVKIKKASTGAMLIDCGIKSKGGFEAGKAATEICLGGCGKTEITFREYGELSLPTIVVYTDKPSIATLGSQFAGWQIKTEGYFAIGSGPARALALKPKDLYEKIGYKDSWEKAVVVLETSGYPPEGVLRKIAEDCNVENQSLYAILVPTESLAGSIQVSGRIVETGLHKLLKLGLDPKVVKYAWGYAPIMPTHPRFVKAMGRTNDAILYGGVAHYIIDYEDEEELERIIPQAVSEASQSYGKPFIEIFKEANYDFYKVDPQLFAPSTIIVSNMKTGKTFKAGKTNPEVIKKSLELFTYQSIEE